MTQVVIGDILPYTQASASGGQTVFGTNWTANAASDVVVYQTPSGTPPDDATQILSYPSQYSVAFIGDSEQVQVTLVTGANAGDIVTITRMTPADYLNLYSNTNFTPSMLNNDFGILTLVDQQAQLVNQGIAPRYNYSAEINNNSMYPTRDTILPLLGANETWVMNSGQTAIIPYTLPSSGIAPASATYVTEANETANLPDSFQLLGTTNQIGLTVGTNQLIVGIASNPIIPGTAGMGIPIGTTAQRVIPGSNINFRYNTSLESLEYYYNGWNQIAEDNNVQPGLINQLAWYAANGDVVSGLATGNYGVLISSATGVPSWLANGTTGQVLTATSSGIVSWQNPATSGTVTSVATNNGLTGGTITTTGTIGLATIATLTGLVNATGGTAVPSATTLTAWIDAAIGSTQGDILYRNSTAWTVLSPGTSGYFLQTQGAAANPIWASAASGGAIVSIKVQTFTAGTSTYTPTSGMVFCVTELVGSGGSAGGCASSANAGAGSSGSGAGYCRKLYTAANIGASATVVVGAAVNGGAAGNNNGTAGNNSTFTCSGTGATLTASGGGKGYGGSNAATNAFTATPADAPGTGTNGDLNISGSYGSTGQGFTTTVILPTSGVSAWGVSVSTSAAGGGPFPGTNGSGYGSGGSAGFSVSSSGNAAGGNSAPGFCIVTEYIA